MTLKEMLNDTANLGSFNIQVPKSIISFLKYKAYHDSEKSGERVTQVSLIKKAIINQYKDEIKKYLKEKGL